MGGLPLQALFTGMVSLLIAKPHFTDSKDTASCHSAETQALPSPACSAHRTLSSWVVLQQESPKTPRSGQSAEWLSWPRSECEEQKTQEKSLIY